MRIVGGKFKSRVIAAPPGSATRPTTDRVREAIFNRLSHGIPGFTINNARTLDLFAGSGAMGLEALSRGARHVLFVDTSERARAAIRRNAEALGVLGLCKIWRRDATRLGECKPAPPFDLVLLDPPYGKGCIEKTLEKLVAGSWLKPGTIIVAEEAATTEFTSPASIAVLDERRYGDTKVMFLQFQGSSPCAPQ
jgi:16S rRNA (guanine966-N2)-methyltransferase